MSFGVEILDTWNMTVTPVDGVFKIIEDGTYRYHADGMRNRSSFPARRISRCASGAVEGDKVAFKESERVYGES